MSLDVETLPEPESSGLSKETSRTEGSDTRAENTMKTKHFYFHRTGSLHLTSDKKR